MPYIKRKNREKFKDVELIALKCDTEGELNYVITKIIMGYLNKRGLIKYAMLNTIVGVLECVRLEFYRRVIKDFENLKKEENGDVY